jgi:hypothetical protein
MKEFLFASALLVLFQYINYDYLTLFKSQPDYLTLQNQTIPATNSTPAVTTQVVAFTVDISSYVYDFASITFKYQDQTPDERLATMI